jgi:hypothetical protein
MTDFWVRISKIQARLHLSPFLSVCHQVLKSLRLRSWGAPDGGSKSLNHIYSFGLLCEKSAFKVLSCKNLGVYLS